MKSLPLALIIVILVISSGVAVVWTSHSMEVEVSRRVGSSLETVLNTVHEFLRTWEERTTASATLIANSEDVRSAVEKQLRVSHRRSDLIRSDALSKLRRLFRPYLEERGYSDFAIITPDGIQVASGLDEFLGQNSMANLNSSLFADVFAGTPGVCDPFQLPPDPHSGGRARINMLVAAPIFDGSGDVI